MSRDLTIRPFSFALVLSACLFAFTGCSAYYDYEFTPGLAEHTLELDQNANPPETVRTLVSIAGVRRANADEDRLASVEVRFLLENSSDREASVLRESLRLVPADLRELDPAEIASGSTTAPPRGQARFTVLFPFPPDAGPSDFNLDGLNVSWSTRVGETTRAQSVTFSREEEEVYDPGPRFHFGTGYYHGHHSYHGW